MKAVTMMIVMVLAMACGPTGRASQIDGNTPTSDGAIRDARTLTPDAAPVGNVVCTAQKTTANNSDGSRTEQTIYWVKFDDIGPTDKFTVESCAIATYEPYKCTPSATVICSGLPFPTGPSCYWSSNMGQFVGGKLVITCGSTYDMFNAAGVRTGGYDQRNTIRIHR